MTEIAIDYNPYKVETNFKMNGKELPPSRFDAIKYQRMQKWLGKNLGWVGLAPALEHLTNDGEITIRFKGRKIDFEDLEAYIKSYQGRARFHLEKPQLVSNDQDIMQKFADIIDECERGPVKELHNPEIRRSYEKAKESIFTVSVIATMSSGKSTLINALLGKELLPSKNESCTATVARITDRDGAKGFTAQCKDENNYILSEKIEATQEMLNQFNSDKNVTYIDIQGDIPYIDSQKMALVMQDTPGPNNSQDPHHKELTEAIIKDINKSVVLYVMNATQLGIKDDHDLLYEIANEMKRGGKQSKDRFIFVVNKCDEIDQDKSEAVDSILAKVANYLGNFGIDNPNLFPVSARSALIFRKKQNGDVLTRKEDSDSNPKSWNDYEESHFEKYANLSPSCRVKVEAALTQAIKNGDELGQALIHTGIPALEATINEYLDKYAYPIKIYDAVLQLRLIIGQKNMESAFEKKIANDKGELEKVKKQIAETRKRKAEFNNGIEKFKTKISEYSSDNSEVNNILDEVDKSFSILTKEFDGIISVSRSEAEYKLHQFQEQADKLQDDLEIKLKNIIENDIVSNGEKMLKEFNSFISEFQSSLTISNYDFNKVEVFRRHKFDDFDDVIRENSYMEDIYDNQTVVNPKRHWFTPWRKKFISKSVKVGEKQIVNVYDVVTKEFGPFSAACKENILQTFNNADKSINDFKNFFNQQIDDLSIKIDDILANIENLTNNESSLQKKVNESENNRGLLHAILNDLDTLMEL